MNNLVKMLQIVLIFFFLMPCKNLFSQEAIDIDMISAEEDLKRGVNTYHRGLFNEAARAFEKALSYKPENNLIQEWLGLAWYRSGFTDSAIRLWDAIEGSGRADSILLNRIEILKHLTGVSEPSKKGVRYLPAMVLQGGKKGSLLFEHPSSILPDNNGGFFVTSYGTNEILRFNANGAGSGKINGGIAGFNHPFDVISAPNGYLYITEFNGDRVSRCSEDGKNLIRFGKTGTGEGQFLGPQFIAADDKNFVYVTDSGNRIVNKYNADGDFILSFGKKSYNFEGFELPTGIVVVNENIYVADGKKADISIFDRSGNFIDKINSKMFEQPEGLSFFNNTIFIADSGSVLGLDLQTNYIRLVSDLDGESHRITKAVVDQNGNLLTTDFDLNTVSVLTELSNMYSGLFVQVDKIVSEYYPKIIVDLRISDREGNPFVGLDLNNFVITENGYSVKKTELVYTGNTDKTVDVSILIDSSIDMKKYKSDTITAVNSLMESAGNRASLRLISSGLNPVTESKLSEGDRQFMAAAGRDFYSNKSNFDLGLSHAASELVSFHGRRSVIFITSSNNSNLSFEKYHPVELASYLKNNGISFYCVNISNDRALSEELKYLCEETGGNELYLYQPKGLGYIYDEIIGKTDGSYSLVYESALSDSSKSEMVSFEIEAFLYNRSGRESSGYFRDDER